MGRPQRSADIAEELEQTPAAVSGYRARLIRTKGLLIEPRRGAADDALAARPLPLHASSAWLGRTDLSGGHHRQGTACGLVRPRRADVDHPRQVRFTPTTSTSKPVQPTSKAWASSV